MPRSVGGGIHRQAVVARGELTRHDLRTHHRRLLPDVYALKHQELTQTDKATAAYLWSHRQAVVAGLAASALHGAKWVGLHVPVELVWSNHRAPTGQRTGWIVVRIVAKTPKPVIAARVRAALQEASRLKVRAAS